MLKRLSISFITGCFGMGRLMREGWGGPFWRGIRNLCLGGGAFCFGVFRFLLEGLLNLCHGSGFWRICLVCGVALWTGTALGAWHLAWRGLALAADGSCSMNHVDSDSGAACRLLLTLPTDPPSRGTVFMLGGGSQRGVWLEAGADGTLSAKLHDERGEQTLNGSATLLPGRNELIIAMDRGPAAGDYPADVAIFVNGREAFSYSGRFAGVTFSKITVGRGFEDASESPWNISDASFSVTFARETKVIEGCREDASGLLLDWRATLGCTNAGAAQPGHCGVFVVSGELSGSVRDWVASQEGTDYTLTEALSSRLVAKFRRTGEAWYSDFSSGTSEPLPMEGCVSLAGEETVTFVLFNWYFGSAYTQTVTGLSGAMSGVRYDLGDWKWRDGGAYVVVAPPLSVTSPLLSINFGGVSLPEGTYGVEPSAHWRTLGPTEGTVATLAGHPVTVSATGTLEGSQEATLMGAWLADASRGPMVKVQGLPEGIYSAILYCGAEKTDSSKGFPALLMESDLFPETPFADLDGAAITALREDSFGGWAAGPRLGRNVLRISNIPVAADGFLTIRGQPANGLGGEGTLAAVQILRQEGLRLDLGGSLRDLGHAIDFQPDPTLFSSEASLEVAFHPSGNEIRGARALFATEGGVPTVQRVIPLGIDGRLSATAEVSSNEEDVVEVTLSKMTGFDALDLPKGWDLLPPASAVTVSETLSASTGMADDVTHRVVHENGLATAVVVSHAELESGKLFGGKYGETDLALLGDTWLDVIGGFYQWIVGGDNCATYSAQHPEWRTHEGNIVLWMQGGTAQHVAGAGFQAANLSKVDGNVLVTVEKDAEVTGHVIGGFRIESSAATETAPEVTGNTLIRLRSLTDSESLLVGGMYSWSGWSPSARILGDSGVEIELAPRGEGVCGKTIVGGCANAWSATILETLGNASVTIDASGTTFPGVLCAGGYGANTFVRGNATMTLRGGTFTGQVLPCSASSEVDGLTTLRLEGSPDLTVATVGAFDRLEVARGAKVMLPDFSAVGCVELFSEGHFASVEVAGDASAYWAGKSYRLNNQKARATYADGQLTLSVGPVPADDEAWPTGDLATERLIGLAEEAGIADGERFSLVAGAVRDGAVVPLSDAEAREALLCFEGLRPFAGNARSRTVGETVRFAYAFGVTEMLPCPETHTLRVTVQIRNANGAPAAFVEGARIRAVSLGGVPLGNSVEASEGNGGILTLDLPMDETSRLFRVEVVASEEGEG